MAGGAVEPAADKISSSPFLAPQQDPFSDGVPEPPLPRTSGYSTKVFYALRAARESFLLLSKFGGAPRPSGRICWLPPAIKSSIKETIYHRPGALHSKSSFSSSSSSPLFVSRRLQLAHQKKPLIPYHRQRLQVVIIILYINHHHHHCQSTIKTPFRQPLEH